MIWNEISELFFDSKKNQFLGDAGAYSDNQFYSFWSWDFCLHFFQ